MFLVLIRWNEKKCKIFFCHPRGLTAFTQTYRAGVIYAWSVCRWLSQWWLVFVFLGFDATEWWGVGFDNTYTVSGKWNRSKVIPRLYGWVYKTLRLSQLVVVHSVVVMSARFNPKGSQFSIPLLWNLCSESAGHKIVRPNWELQHWWSEFNYCLEGILTWFSILILWTLCGKPTRERQKALLC